MSDSVRPHRRQPIRLPHPWDSPGMNTGVGCHFLLQCMKVKSESEAAQSCPTLSDPMDCSLPGSSIHGIVQARVLEWGAIAFSNDHPRQHIKKQRHYFAKKGPSSQGYGFSSGHVWMWELDCKESWVPKMYIIRLKFWQEEQLSLCAHKYKQWQPGHICCFCDSKCKKQLNLERLKCGKMLDLETMKYGISQNRI